jgi:DNA-binding transcriptional ArsR family regulator
MVKYDSLDSTFGALANPTRRAILSRLTRGEATITELARPFAVSLPAISKHVRVLEGAGLLRRTRVGRAYRCRLRAHPLREAEAWINDRRQFWGAKLDSLARYLDNPNEQEDK